MQPFLSKSFEGVREIQFSDPPAGYVSDPAPAANPVLRAGSSTGGVPMGSADADSDAVIQITSPKLSDLLLSPTVLELSRSGSGSGATNNSVITAMLSAEGECVDFVGFVDPHKGNRKGCVEVWMCDVEDAMRSTVKDHMGRALKAYSHDSRNSWILSWPGQVVLAADQVLWTHMTESALRAVAEQPTALTTVLATFNDQLQGLVSLVRGQLTELQRATLTALITLQVHGRDVVAALVDRRAQNTDDFEWYAQLRHYWIDESGVVASYFNDGAASVTASGQPLAPQRPAMKDSDRSLSFGMARPKARGKFGKSNVTALSAAQSSASQSNDSGPKLTVRTLNASQVRLYVCSLKFAP